MKKAVKVYKAYVQLTFCCFFLGSFFTLHAQDTVRGKVEVIKDPRIDSFAAHRAELHKANGLASGATTASGYRIQIFNGSGRREAFDVQSKFQEKFPDVHTYITYREPNFKVRAGDYRTRLEATKMMEELKPWFNGMFIISETINLPKLEPAQ
jgi:hypothetical protein